MKNPFDQQKPIPGVKKIIAISSGKGGVGKSTIAVHLAMELSKHFQVGLLDADIYGPSVPRMMGAINQVPEVTEAQRVIPIERHGLKTMSIGYLTQNEEVALIWRGPMLFKAIEQLLFDVEWGDLDYLIVDLPPGTGDVQLSLAQKVPIMGVITVCTPQNIALTDVKKSIQMFEQCSIPILGVIENMAFFVNPQTGEKQVLFPPGELNAYLDQKGLKKLAQIPFHPALAMACEVGIPLNQKTEPTPETKEFQGLVLHLKSLNH